MWERKVEIAHVSTYISIYRYHTKCFLVFLLLLCHFKPSIWLVLLVLCHNTMPLVREREMHIQQLWTKLVLCRLVTKIACFRPFRLLTSYLSFIILFFLCRWLWKQTARLGASYKWLIRNKPRGKYRGVMSHTNDCQNLQWTLRCHDVNRKGFSAGIVQMEFGHQLYKL